MSTRSRHLRGTRAAVAVALVAGAALVSPLVGSTPAAVVTHVQYATGGSVDQSADNHA
jgi:hypothetical protein